MNNLHSRHIIIPTELTLMPLNNTYVSTIFTYSQPDQCNGMLR